MPFIRVRRERGGTRVARLVLVTASIAFIAAGLVLAGQTAWFLHSSSVHGAALVQRERRAIGVSRRVAPTCQSPGPGHLARAATGTPRGLLEISALGLVAPVLQGTGDAVLNDAVALAPSVPVSGLLVRANDDDPATTATPGHQHKRVFGFLSPRWTGMNASP